MNSKDLELIKQLDYLVYTASWKENLEYSFSCISTEYWNLVNLLSFNIDWVHPCSTSLDTISAHYEALTQYLKNCGYDNFKKLSVEEVQNVDEELENLTNQFNYDSLCLLKVKLETYLKNNE